MDGAHDTALDGRELVEGVGHRGEAVGGAGSGADHGVGRGQGLVVGVVDDGRKVLARRSGDDDLLRAGLDVRGGLLLGGVEAGALEDDIHFEFAPRELSRIGLRIDGDFLAVHDDGTGGDNRLAVFSEDGVLVIHRVLSFTELAGEATLGGVVLQEVSKHFGAGEVIDGDHFVTISLEHLTERQTTDTAKTVDSNSIHVELG